MATTDSRRRAAAELEARIAQLDERLRMAKNNTTAGNNNTTTATLNASGTSAGLAASGANMSRNISASNYDPTLSPLPKATAGLMPAAPPSANLAAQQHQQQHQHNSSGVFDRSSGMPNVTPVRGGGGGGHDANMSGYYAFAATTNDLQLKGATPMPANRQQQQQQSPTPAYDGYIASPLYVDPSRLGNGVRGAAPIFPGNSGQNSISSLANGGEVASFAAHNANAIPAPATAADTTNAIYGVPAVAPTVGSTASVMSPYTVQGASGLTVPQQQQQQQQLVVLPPASPSQLQQHHHASGYEAFSSPWREAAFRSQLEANAQLQMTAVDTRGRRLDAMVKDVEDTNKGVSEADAQLLWYTARKDNTAAEMHKYLRESNEKVADLERAEIKVITETSQIKLDVEKAQQQLKEVRESMARATDRAHAINSERAQIEAAMKGAADASAAKAKAEAEWLSHHAETIMAQLQSRIKSATEEVKSAQDRHNAREQSLHASRAASANEIKALCAEIDGSRGILIDLSSRSDALGAELAALKQHAVVAQQQRQQRAAEAEARRKAALAHELGRVQEENAMIVRKVTQQADHITAQLKDEVADLSTKLAKTGRAKEAATAVNTSLAEKLAMLQAAVQHKQDAEPECKVKEQQVKELLEARDTIKNSIGAVQRSILAAQDDIRVLEVQSSRLTELLDEESRLKTLLASLSQEMASSTALRMEDVSQHDESARAVEAAHGDALAKVAVAENELHRVKSSNAAILDSLTRKLHEARERLSTKEKTLDELLTKNTQLQNTIIQYEEEKRRMERDAMNRKEAASRAAKAALLDLA